MKTIVLLFSIVLVFLSLTLSPQARATCQEGCDFGNFNTFLGENALINNTTGGGNVAVGWYALASNTTGRGNAAIGQYALFLNTTGYLNTASGAGALYTNTTGFFNAATGANALGSNNTGHDNTANGNAALFFNTTGNENMADGAAALASNTIGNDNVACGFDALRSNTAGSSNTAAGFDALYSNSTGSNNIALGQGAGFNLTTGDNNIDIGNEGVGSESGVIHIGTEGIHTATYIAGIREARFARGTAVAVGITADGQLGVRASSARFNEAIQPMDEASGAILSLKPVTFRYKRELDPEGIPQFGLVAEEVEKVNPNLVARDEQGKPYTVRYEAVNAMLLNEFLKEHRKVEGLQAGFAQQQKDFQSIIARQQKQLEALTAGLKKVSAQLEVSKPIPQIVANNQ